MSMVTDGNAKGDPSLGWPGDLKAKGRITTLADYVNILVRGGYLKPNDLHIFSGAGYEAYKGTLTSGSNGVLSPAFEDEKNCAFKIFLVKEADSSNTIFLASKNYTYNSALDDKAKPFGDKGFVVVRKGGDARILKKTQAKSNNLHQIIGTLPGGGTAESVENCLNPTVP